MITLDDLRAICRHTSPAQLELFVQPLNKAMREFEIDENVARETHFLAQVAHESGGFNYVQWKPKCVPHVLDGFHWSALPPVGCVAVV